jgi:membrane-associated protease RseP (regulator of RpoE activity)
MRTHFGLHATLLALCLSLAASAAFAGDGPQPPPAPAAPPPACGVTSAGPNPPRLDQAALQACLERARRQMEVAAQQLAALSAQMAGPMMRRYAMFGPPHALIGVQLGGANGQPGAQVREVSPGGPADRAGVRAGDLIVAVNGKDVRGADPARRVVELLRGTRPGDKVNLRVLRDGKSHDFVVTARPDMVQVFGGAPIQLPDLPVPPFKALSGWGGAPMIIRGPVADMELARLTPGLGRYFGTDTGVLVVRAPPDGALGLQDGDVILSIGGRKPIDSSHVIRILGSYDPGERITLEVMRLHRKISVATTMPAGPAMPRRVLMLRGPETLAPGAVVTVSARDPAL